MKTQYALVALLCMAYFTLSAQTYYDPYQTPYPKDINDTLEANAVKALFHASGDMFFDLEGEAYYRVAPHDSLNTLFAGHLWMGAIDNSGNIRSAAQTYRQSDNNYQPGPVSSLYDSVYNQRYHKVWKMSQATIDQHIANWQSPNYVVPSSIASWPAHGDTAHQEAYYLAPFMDVNGSGVYEPSLGDYPLIRGDQALYIIFNDDRYSAFSPLKMETHLMAYGFADPSSPALNESIFLHYKVFNRSAQLYHDAWIGYWSDLELGYVLDDDMGTDSALNTLYVYNRDNMDGPQNGFGQNPPAQGISMLNMEMSASMTYYVDYTDDSIGGPVIGPDYYQFLQGKWKDGQSVTQGGTGRGGSQATTYFLNGDPVSNTGWVANNGSNTFFSYDAKDVRGLLSHGPFVLGPGESICMDLALVYARDPNQNNLENLSLLRQRINEVRNHYFSQDENCLSAPANRPITSLIEEGEVLLFPNPAQEIVQLRWENDFEQIRVYDLQGRLVFQQSLGQEKYLRLSIADWVPGFYTINFANDRTQIRQRFVKTD
ncbi:MAG: T9SS type A sorting domain-containing protein [Bacteroidota bacterium]